VAEVPREKALLQRVFYAIISITASYESGYTRLTGS